jgi:hypothetical protein
MVASAPPETPAATARALDSAQRFLLKNQSLDGHWSEWELPPGPSDCWTTAYVGYQLATADEPVLRANAAARRAAASWLGRRESEGGGWGYNDRVGADADSTAWALLFLCAERRPALLAAYQRLTSLQQPDGGFATYPPDAGLGSWGASHPDVSALAARALVALSRAESCSLAAPERKREAQLAVGRALEYITSQRKSDGTWNSFWWSSPLYATAASLSLLRAAGLPLDAGLTRAGLRRMSANNPFERALLLDCHVQLSLDASGFEASPPLESSPTEPSLVEQLVSEQLADGSWQHAPILRLTNRSRLDPGAGTGSGPLFTDPGRLFTSATVLGALSRFERAHASWRTAEIFRRT